MNTHDILWWLIYGTLLGAPVLFILFGIVCAMIEHWRKVLIALGWLVAGSIGALCIGPSAFVIGACLGILALTGYPSCCCCCKKEDK